MTCLVIDHHGLRESDAAAGHHDLIDGISEKLGLRSLRDALYRRASGRVLEITAGTGFQRAHYPAGCEAVGVDVNRSDLLPFEDETFDTVTSCLSLCRFANPAVLLREMSRVCKPHGRILVLEHGRSDRPWIGEWQDRRATAHAERGGCRPNRDSLGLMRRAGLQIVHAQSSFFGMVHVIEAMPAPRN